MPAAADLWLRDAAYRGLLDDVIEHPDDDTPRLVMADWLEEHGDEVAQDRARFIRLQLERAKLSEHHPRAWQLRGQERALLRTHRAAWLGRLEKMTSKVVFHRGFPDEIVLGVAMLAKNAEALFTLTPVRHLQVLRVSQSKLTMTDLARLDGLKRLRGLCLRNSGLSDDRLEELFTTLDLPHLEALDLTGTGVSYLALRALVKRSPARLRSLYLAGSAPLWPFAEVLKSLSAFTLADLNLSGRDLSREGIGELSRWAGLSSVRRLALNDVAIGAGGCRLLVESPHLGELERLDLAGATVRINGAAAIGRCARLATLRHLDVTNTMIDHAGLDHLLASPHLHGLESFSFGGIGMHGRHLGRLWSWPGLARIRHLRIGFVYLGNEGLRSLLAAPLGEVTSLDLSHTGLAHGAAEVIASCERLRSLAALDLTGCLMTGSEANLLLDSPHLTALQRLDITPIRFTAADEARYKARFPDED